MQITSVRRRNGNGAYLVTALVGTEEFKQLGGELSHIMLCPHALVTEPATHTTTGSKIRAAKYALIPIKIRRRYLLDEYDFSELRCTAVENDDRVFLVYSIPKRPGGKVKVQVQDSHERGLSA